MQNISTLYLHFKPIFALALDLCTIDLYGPFEGKFFNISLLNVYYMDKTIPSIFSRMRDQNIEPGMNMNNMYVILMQIKDTNDTPTNQSLISAIYTKTLIFIRASFCLVSYFNGL